MADRKIRTEVILDGKDEFIRKMNEMTAAMRRAEDAAKSLSRALADIPAGPIDLNINSDAIAKLLLPPTCDTAPGSPEQS